MTSPINGMIAMKMNVVLNERAQNRPPSRLIWFVALLVLVFAAACTGHGATGNLATPIETISPPDSAIEAPPALIEQPLNGAAVAVPEVWLVPSLQSKDELATHLMVEVEQLDWVNPGLPQQVAPGTLVVVPPTALARGPLDLPAFDEVERP